MSTQYSGECDQRVVAGDATASPTAAAAAVAETIRFFRSTKVMVRAAVALVAGWLLRSRRMAQSVAHGDRLVALTFAGCYGDTVNIYR